MEMIIRMILKIFDAVFEEDVKSRQRPTQPIQPAHPPQAQGPAGRQGGQPVPRPKNPQGAQDPLAMWLEEVMGKQQKKGAGKPARKVKRRPPPQPEHQETLQEHLRQTEARSHHLEEHMREYLGVHEETHTRKKPKLERMLGPNPLKQMVIADVILGPPVSKRRGGRP